VVSDMEAHDEKFGNLVYRRRQYVVPIWQREYSWGITQLEELWNDIMRLYEKPPEDEIDPSYFQATSHFMGSIVLKPKQLGGVEKYIVIDGQQRHTTLLVLLALIRDQSKKDNISLSNTIQNSYLLNSDIKNTDELYKLRPTEPDRLAFEKIMSGESPAIEEERQMAYAYWFFKGKLEKQDKNGDISLNLETLKEIIVDKLRMVEIILDKEDDPNRIFETLNSRGLELEKADLVRNYFMMKMRDEIEAENLYKHTWLPMQQSLRGSYYLTKFFRDYLRMDKHTHIKEDDIYHQIQKKLKFSSQNETKSELQNMKGYSDYYERLLFPQRESNIKIRTGIERLKRWDVGTAYPFLLKAYNAYAHSQILSEDDFSRILNIIESFAVRRHFCGLKTNSLNVIFPALCELDEGKLADSLQDKLMEYQWNRRWPGDDDFKEGFKTFPIYLSGNEKCRLALDSLEESLGHPEKVALADLTIEHVMPETFDEEWQKYLGSDWKRIKTEYLHTIGNLTLIAGPPNSTIQNKLFSKKKEEWYTHSHVELTQEIARRWSEWREAEIAERASLLAERAVKIWAHP
jgi:uncharacterized protein with ParB-like and HNH nuclease domain